MLGFHFNTRKPLNLLFLGAHCDDIEIGAGGTALRILDEYAIASVHWIVFASNTIRKREAENSAASFLLKAAQKEIIVHSWRDGFLPFIGGDIKEYFETLKQTIAPDIIFTHYRDDRHQDHRILSDLTWNTWRDQLIFEYEIPKNLSLILFLEYF